MAFLFYAGLEYTFVDSLAASLSCVGENEVLPPASVFLA